LSIKDKLTLGDVQELFTVRSSRAAYWRVIALDWFTDDNAWGINKATEQAASKLSTPSDLPVSADMHQQFHIGVLDPHWLPAAYRPVGINLTAARVVPDSLTLLVDSKAELNDLVYDVSSKIPTPSEFTLGAAPFSDPVRMARDLELPSDFSARVNALAQRIIKNARTPYERVVALENFFRSGEFTYTLDTHLGDSPDELAEFLLETKAGFCEQFAASFAAMARVVGVPARVAVGYQPGDYRDGLFHTTPTRGRRCGSKVSAGSPSSPHPASRSRRSGSPPAGRGRSSPRPRPPPGRRVRARRPHRARCPPSHGEGAETSRCNRARSSTRPTTPPAT
jgi:hypothetical protein